VGSPREAFATGFLYYRIGRLRKVASGWSFHEGSRCTVTTSRADERSPCRHVPARWRSDATKIAAHPL
jgi:hypothetical protein